LQSNNKGKFFLYAEYIAQELEYLPKDNGNVLPKTYQGNSIYHTDGALN
jgi:hypothetical protein